jgi:pilus assembly protein Flp/PilA
MCCRKVILRTEALDVSVHRSVHCNTRARRFKLYAVSRRARCDGPGGACHWVEIPSAGDLKVFVRDLNHPIYRIENWVPYISGITNLMQEQEMVLIKRFVSDESGATAIEYGLIAAGIALAIITVVNGLGTTMNDKFTSISSAMK